MDDVQSMQQKSRSEQELRIVRARRMKVFRRIGIAALILLVLGGVIAALVITAKRRQATLPGELYPSVGQEHISISATPPKPYNSNPPSSGGHYAGSANWGVYDYEVNDKIFIHNLEHGGIWIAYRPTISPQALQDLKNIVNELGGSKIVMAPRSASDADVAVVAWTRVLKFNLSGGELTPDNASAIRAFYKGFKNRGPEFVPDSMPGIDPKSVQ